MRTSSDWKRFSLITGVFLAAFYLPLSSGRFSGSILSALGLLQEYAREHVILCLIPALFIAGAISIFLSGESVIRYLGSSARKFVAYGVASVSGSVLAVCSCSVLPIFAGIYTRGAGIGPATAFLYAGPAVNVLAIILTANVLGFELGLARAVGAVVFSVVIGLLMSLLFRKSEAVRMREVQSLSSPTASPRGSSTLRSVAIFAALIAILVASNWNTGQNGTDQSSLILKWTATALSAGALLWMLVAWKGVKWWKPLLLAAAVAALVFLVPGGPNLPFGIALLGFGLILGTTGGEASDWLDESWSFGKQILPLLFAGVLVAGFLLGRPGTEGMIPSSWVAESVGGNSITANLFASVVGALMYFATLTEIPILQGLLGAGMGKGPALALLLAGPALSLPNMLVIRSVLGTRQTLVYVMLVVTMATISGSIFGMLI